MHRTSVKFDRAICALEAAKRTVTATDSPSTSTAILHPVDDARVADFLQRVDADSIRDTSNNIQMTPENERLIAEIALERNRELDERFALQEIAQSEALETERLNSQSASKKTVKRSTTKKAVVTKSTLTMNKALSLFVLSYWAFSARFISIKDVNLYFKLFYPNLIYLCHKLVETEDCCSLRVHLYGV